MMFNWSCFSILFQPIDGGGVQGELVELCSHSARGGRASQYAEHYKTYFLRGKVLSKRIRALTEELPMHQIQTEPLSSGGDRRGQVRGITNKQSFWLTGHNKARSTRGENHRNWYVNTFFMRKQVSRFSDSVSLCWTALGSIINNMLLVCYLANENLMSSKTKSYQCHIKHLYLFEWVHKGNLCLV